MKKLSINIKELLSAGGIALGALADDNAVLALVTESTQLVVPIIGTKAYIGTDDNADILDALVQQIQIAKVFPGTKLDGANIIWATPPAHSHTIKAFIMNKDLVQYEGLNDVLTHMGYTVDIHSGCKRCVRDRTELRANDPFAEEIYQETKKKLEAEGATFESLPLEAKLAAEGLMAGDHCGIIFTGDPGTGKSWATDIIATHFGAPCLHVGIEAGTTSETLLGTFVPATKEPAKPEVAEKLVQIMKEKPFTEALDAAYTFLNRMGEQAKWKFVPGPLTTGCIEGWAVTLEEGNNGNPGVLAILNGFTDQTQRININGVSYKRHPNFIVMMTMNPGFPGTEPLNGSLKNRFATVDMSRFTKEQFTNKMVDYTTLKLGHALSRKFFEKLYDFSVFAARTAYDWGEAVVCSVRNAQRLCSAILLKPHTLEEFAAEIAVQYLNQLSLDNNNTERLATLKASETVQNTILELFNLYDYTATKTVNILPKLETLFSVVDTEGTSSGAEIDDLYTEAALDSILK